MLRLPKQKFIDSPHKEEWKKVLNQPCYEEAVTAALTQFVSELPEVPTPNVGWDQASQLAGIRRFISILTDLPVPEEQAQKIQFKNLKSPQ